jgi:hypothetical protein
MVLFIHIPTLAIEDVFRRIWAVSRFDRASRRSWSHAAVAALLRPEPGAKYFQAPVGPDRMGDAHGVDPHFHSLRHYQSGFFGLMESMLNDEHRTVKPSGLRGIHRAVFSAHRRVPV